MKPLRRVTYAEACAAKARADALAEAVKVAEAWASKGANAASVFMVLAGRAIEAREDLDLLRVLDEEPAATAVPAGSSSSALEAAEESCPGGNALPASAASSVPDVLTASSAPPGEAGTLTDNQRLVFLAESLGKAAAALDDPRARRVFGGAGKSIADYLRTVRAYAAGAKPSEEIEPQSIHVDHDTPRLRVVK